MTFLCCWSGGTCRPKYKFTSHSGLMHEEEKSINMNLFQSWGVLWHVELSRRSAELTCFLPALIGAGVADCCRKTRTRSSFQSDSPFNASDFWFLLLLLLIIPSMFCLPAWNCKKKRKANGVNGELDHSSRTQPPRRGPPGAPGADPLVRQSHRHHRSGRHDHFGQHRGAAGDFLLRGWLVQKLPVLLAVPDRCGLCLRASGHTLKPVGQRPEGPHGRALPRRGLLQRHHLLHLHVHAGHDQPGEVRGGVLPAAVLHPDDEEEVAAPDRLRLVLPSFPPVAHLVSGRHHRGPLLHRVAGLQPDLLHQCGLLPEPDGGHLFPLLHRHDFLQPESVVRRQETAAEAAPARLCSAQPARDGVQGAGPGDDGLLHLLDALHGGHDIQR